MLSDINLLDMSSLEITQVDRNSLIDIDTVKINTSLPIEQRLESFIKQIKNPYCFLCGDTPVRVRFVSPEKTLAESLGDYFTSLK